MRPCNHNPPNQLSRTSELVLRIRKRRRATWIASRRRRAPGGCGGSHLARSLPAARLPGEPGCHPTDSCLLPLFLTSRPRRLSNLCQHSNILPISNLQLRDPLLPSYDFPACYFHVLSRDAILCTPSSRNILRLGIFYVSLEPIYLRARPQNRKLPSKAQRLPLDHRWCFFYECLIMTS